MSDTSGRLFSKPAKFVITVMVAVGLLALAGVFLIDAEDSINSVASDSYSVSGVGHKALLLLLRDQGIPVAVNRHPHGRGITAKDLLLVLEPSLPFNESKRLNKLLDGKKRVLLALPKWIGIESIRNPAWIYESRLRPVGQVERIAEILMEAPRVRRSRPSLVWEKGVFDAEPTIASLQLLQADELVPMIERRDGVLFGRLAPEVEVAPRQEGIFLLSDPDLFNNHGLHQGDNARLMLSLIEYLLPSGGTLYIDESLHGHGRLPSLVLLMLAPPYVGVSILILLVTALVVWMTLVPFGTPLESQSGADEQLSGHQTLIENSGRLLVAGGYMRHLVERYQWSVMEEVGLRVGVKHQGARSPEEMGALRHRLNRVLGHRGVMQRLPDPTLARGNLQAHARACHEWMKGVLGDE